MRSTTRFDAFRHPADIPVAFALAVQRVVASTADYNQSTADDWDVLDTTYPSVSTTLRHIERIYQENGSELSPDDRAWWQEQLFEDHPDPRDHPAARQLFRHPNGQLLFVTSVHDDIVEFIESENGRSAQMNLVDWQGVMSNTVFLGFV